MIIEKDGLRIQRSIIETNWLYIDDKDTRIFVKEASLGKEAEALPECTNEEKELWEEQHRLIEDIEEIQENVENSQKEVNVTNSEIEENDI